MTKFYEEYLRYKVDDLKLFEENLKGELTIVISEKLGNKNKKPIKNMLQV